MSQAAPAEGAAAEKKRPLLRRVPTSLLVTLLGIGLSAWLLPAVSRQWDDRQKARSLQASLVTQISTATADALAAGRSLLLRPPKSVRPPAKALASNRATAAWSTASIQTEARLRSYFPESVVESWATYSYDLGVFLQDLATPGTGFSGPTPIYFPPTIPLATLGAIEKGREYRAAFRAERQTLSARERYFGHLRGHSAEKRDRLEVDLIAVVNGYSRAETRWLKVEEGINSEILAARPRGFSTTWRDLFHDLIP
jgi:1-acyl-sn-glycerol-3-phosphate acyltransferase